MKFENNYLRKKFHENPLELNAIRESWEMPEGAFIDKVDKWFTNFSKEDYDLAYNILKEIDYYSKSRYRDKLSEIKSSIEKFIRKPLKDASVLLIMPDAYGDSAHMHSYHLIKEWEIPIERICVVSKLEDKKIDKDTVLIAFNDTYGSGKQFIEEMFDKQKTSVKNILLRSSSLFIVGLTISEIARKYIINNLGSAKVFPEESPRRIFDNNAFTFSEVTQIMSLGADIYPPHPTGYGGTGLLLAYEHQCPNNSIPLIWANGKNNEFEDSAFNWVPLFEYRPKIKEEKKIEKKGVRVKKKFNHQTKLKFASEDIHRINEIINSWQCSRANHNRIVERLNNWFSNFELSNKELALRIFEKINYLSLARTRAEIKKLRDQVLREIELSCGGTKRDIVLVITGNDLESDYHYVYDFMRIWSLQISNVLTLEHIIKHPYEAVDKHLVFFYHTRIHKTETFFSEIWPKIQNLPAAKFHVLSFMMSDVVKVAFQAIRPNKLRKKIKYYYSESLSRTVKDSLSDYYDESLSQEEKNHLYKKDLNDLCAILKRNGIGYVRNIGDKYLTSYYFMCPKDSIPLLWSNNNNSALF